MEQFSNIITKQYRGCGFMTIAKYNNNGDIIYIADKESKIITAVETINHTIIGIFEGHNGVIWSLDLSSDDSILISASGDLSIIFWNAKNGIIINQFIQKCIPKYVTTQKNLLTNYVAILCEALSKKSTTNIIVYDLNCKENLNEIATIDWEETSKPSVILWLNETKIIIGTDSGLIIIKDIFDKEFKEEYKFHNSFIKSIVFNKNKTQILTGSLDATAKQIDLETWTVIKTYVCSVPINFASFNHNDRKVLIGGGIEAMMIAKTSNNDLNLKIYRTSDQKLINHISSHFGPIRYIDRSPYSKNFITASQDGTVKIYFIKENDNITIENSDVIEKENFIKYEKFGSIIYDDPESLILSEDINKIENLSWKPPKNIQNNNKPIPKYVPGMQKPVQEKSVFKNINNDKNNNNQFFQISNYVSNDKFNQTVDEVEINENYINSTIRVTNLPYDMEIRELCDIFDTFGRIEENGIKIKHYQDTTMAFIKYCYLEGAEKAINAMNKKAIYHSIINVEISKPNR